MEIKDGKIEIDVEELIKDEKVLRECAKEVIFSETVVEGLIKLMTADEIDWDDESLPWWKSIHFGRRCFEDARLTLIKKADEAAQKQVELLKKERDTFEKYWNEGIEENGNLKREIDKLKYELHHTKEALKSMKEDNENRWSRLE